MMEDAPGLWRRSKPINARPRQLDRTACGFPGDLRVYANVWEGPRFDRAAAETRLAPTPKLFIQTDPPRNRYNHRPKFTPNPP